MALVAFLRGVNVGGHKTFRPSQLAKDLSDYGVVNVGAAGTFVVRKPGPRTKFLTELQKRLPFTTAICLCDGRDLLEFVADAPFGAAPPRPDIVRFVTVMSKTGPGGPDFPVLFPAKGQWLVRVIGATNQFVFGEYRRHMKTIGYLGQIDKLFDAPVTTRNWNTINAVVRLLEKSE
jgi:uncharacterized protein (DUF1697 family)